jgi:hypothetical protein
MGRNMKRLCLLLIAFILVLTGCSSGKSTSTASTENSTQKAVVESSKKPEESEKPQGYIFETNGISIAMNAKVAPILEKLGKEKSYFEAESCAFQGMDKTYTYNGFELHTYELNKVDYVASVIFLDDSVSTKEGITLNADIKDVLRLYGDKYTNKSNLYTFQLDKSKLSFMIENDKITSVEYTAITE